MRKYLTANFYLPIHLSWCGMLLLALRQLLLVRDILEKDSGLSMALMWVSIAAIIAGAVLRLYQQKQVGQVYLRNFAFGILIGLALTVVLMMTGMVHTPSFISEWFR